MLPRHSPLAPSAVLCCALLSLAGEACRADALAALNLVRRTDCPAPGTPPLRRSARLDAAAERLARGGHLHDALLGSGYRATSAAAIHLAGPRGDQPTTQALSGHYCREIADASLREAGFAEHGPDLWLVVAAPLVPPAPGEAANVNRRVLELVNSARSRGSRCGSRYFAAVPPLRLASPLTTAALSHSQDMARHSEFEHQGHDGSSPAERVRRAGYRSRAVGENIAAGVQSPDEAVAGWLASPEHCANIMNARFVETGVAYATNLESTSAIYWTQVFATPR
jgi:uncharacterized protein YkwD